jgi:hypothetical protein
VRRTAALLVLGLILTAAPARAGMIDGNDTPGKLDIDDAHAFRNGVGQGDAVRVRIQMLAGFGAHLLDESGPNRFFLYFDTMGDASVDFRGTISTVNGVIQMTIVGGGETYGPLTARHQLATELNVTLPEAQPYNPNGAWNLWITSRFTNDRRCSTPCVDRYPNDGSIRVPAGDGSSPATAAIGQS